MYDTVAAFTSVPSLAANLFGGGSVVEDFDTGRSRARLWLNPGEAYAPRVTYWPEAELLKLEFSISKMADVDPQTNTDEAAKERALDNVNAFARQFGDLPDVRTWTVQRVDYCWMWDCGEQVDEYLHVMSELVASGMARSTYKHGVVWKAGNRWTKFYRRKQMLRFEVSNYRDAVVYMAKHWFQCERTVEQMLKPERAIRCMAEMWKRLGLDGLDEYKASDALLCKLRETYSNQVGQAFYVLHLIIEFGSQAIARGLVSSSSFYRWKRRLAADGFLAMSETTMDALLLPSTENLKTSHRAQPSIPSKNSVKILEPGS